LKTSPAQEDTPRTEPPLLVVDLDGCLIRTDLLVESCLLLLKSNPFYLFVLPLWLCRGRAHLKREIAHRIELDAALLPYSHEFLEFLRSEKAANRRLILATASDQRMAAPVAEHLDLFEAVLASDGRNNLTGERKLVAIRAHCAGASFDYAGNAAVDLRIWPEARAAIVVNPSSGLEKAVRKVAAVERVFPRVSATPRDYLKGMRVHQWLKNLLLFVPMFTSHKWLDLDAWLALTVGFFAFSLCASSTYIVNDLLDLAADRAHPAKRARPFAAGLIPITTGLAIAPISMAIGLAAAAWVGWEFFGYLVLYVAVTAAYSLHLKALALVDTVTLAGLYTLRILAGGAAAQAPISFWLLAFSMFLFMSLALVKRYSELAKLASQHQLATKGRDYRLSDLPFVGAMGVASGYLSVLVIAFFVQSPEVAQRYTRPQALWFLCPLFLYWVSRMWLKAGRGEMHHDPMVYALRDRTSRLLMFAVVAIVLIAT
jgi:4-hydroxybenzoate polyprenyltransferase